MSASTEPEPDQVVFPARFVRFVVIAFAAVALLTVLIVSSSYLEKTPTSTPGKSWTGLVPDKGVFLVAKPRISSGPFSRSVVLLLAHEEEGTLGLIINRSTDVPVGDVLPELEGGEDSHSLFFGGPVSLNGLMFLFRTSEPQEASHVMGDVYFSGDKNALESLLDQGKGPDELRLYLGHSGWSPGQLDSELERGDWELIRADAETVFQKKPDEIWPEFFDLTDGSLVARGLLLRFISPQISLF